VNYQKLAFWRNRRGLTSLVVGVLFSMTAVPAYGEYEPRNRKPASGYSRAGAGCCR